MKVGTDSVILGAWVSVENVRQALDVGTGTGILSLMLAQRINGLIEAVEIDGVEIVKNAYQQAQRNVENSPWKQRITIFHDSFQDYSTKTSKKYDLIISNPPYFINSYKSNQTERTLARHSDELPWDQLIGKSAELLNDSGRIALIIPAEGYNFFSGIADKYGLQPLRVLKIFPKPLAPLKRIAVEYSFSAGCCIEEELIIEEGGRHVYSKEYKSLTKDFYL